MICKQLATVQVEEAGDEKIVAECAWSDTATTVLSIDGVRHLHPFSLMS